MSTPLLPQQFINWRQANQQHDANVENQQRDFRDGQIRRKELMESLNSHAGWKLLATFLASKAEEAMRAAEDAETPHVMATNLMLAKAYRTLLRFPSDTIALADGVAKQR
jgi:regulatory protein YycI of two-component signal transduction system YycFG